MMPVRRRIILTETTRTIPPRGMIANIRDTAWDIAWLVGLCLLVTLPGYAVFGSGSQYTDSTMPIVVPAGRSFVLKLERHFANTLALDCMYVADPKIVVVENVRYTPLTLSSGVIEDPPPTNQLWTFRALAHGKTTIGLSQTGPPWGKTCHATEDRPFIVEVR